MTTIFYTNGSDPIYRDCMKLFELHVHKSHNITYFWKEYSMRLLLVWSWQSSFILIGCWVCLFFAASRLNISIIWWSMRKPSMKLLLNCGETPINLSLEGWDCSSKDGAKVGLDWQFIPLAGFNHQLRSWR